MTQLTLASTARMFSSCCRSPVLVFWLGKFRLLIQISDCKYQTCFNVCERFRRNSGLSLKVWTIRLLNFSRTWLIKAARSPSWVTTAPCGSVFSISDVKVIFELTTRATFQKPSSLTAAWPHDDDTSDRNMSFYISSSLLSLLIWTLCSLLL